jgi:hypothetical protein
MNGTVVLIALLPGDLVDLAAKMSGCASKAASSKRKLVLLEVFRFIAERFEDSVDKELLSIARTLEQRAVMQKIDLEYTQYRAQVQGSAVSDHRTTFTANL